MLRILPLTLILLGSSGCQPDQTPKWVGEWLGSNEGLVDQKLAEQNPVLAGNLRRVHLTLRSDRTFELIRAGLPSEGNYTVGNGTATLTVISVLGKPVDGMSEEVKKQNVPIKLNLNEDGTISMIDSADFGRDPVILTRKDPK